ncbi:hypothetical protein AGMMS49938_18580 [Fibrobacterales bacterium]|nr:hypothetical protein AGMMS49938_18580 [Fibrobacterales bacterium]
MGLGFGSMVNTKCRSLWTWNAQATYYYNSFFAGGTGLKFMGGNLDSANNLIYQRYSLQGYFYTDKQKYALFISPIFSFDNTSLSTLSDEFRRIGNDYEIPAENEIRTNTECRELFEEIGSSIGYQTGLGYQITPIWGFSFGHSTDWIFKGNYIVSFSGSFAFNLREFSQRLLDNTQNLYVFLEYSNSFTKFSNPMHFLILGFMVGF